MAQDLTVESMFRDWRIWKIINVSIEDNDLSDMKIVYRDLAWANEDEKAACACKVEQCTARLKKKIRLTESEGRKRLEQKQDAALDQEDFRPVEELDPEGDDRRADPEVDKLCDVLNAHVTFGAITSNIRLR